MEQVTPEQLVVLHDEIQIDEIHHKPTKALLVDEETLFMVSMDSILVKAKISPIPQTLRITIEQTSRFSSFVLSELLALGSSHVAFI